MKLSVIIPQSLTDPRGQFEFIKSWCQQSGVSAEDYEVVVAVNDRDASAVRRCRELVRPHDRVVAFHGVNDMHYYEAGINAARGRLLLLTENHVVADEHCVANVLSFFERTDTPAAFLKAKHINHSRFARHEGEAFDRQVDAVWLQPDCWDGVHLRGFVIDRAVLADAGGVPWQYELFCSRLLSLRMRQRSILIEYFPDAVVYHVNVTDREFLQYEIRSYVENEFRYRDTEASIDEEIELGSSCILDERRIWQDNLIGKAAASLLQSIRSRFSSKARERSALPVKTLFATALQWRIAAAVGPKMLMWRALLKYLWIRLRYGVLQYFGTSGTRAYEQLWGAMADVERARYCVEHFEAPGKCDSDLFPAGSRYIGFHGLEEWRGVRFRWSGPVALLSLELAADDYQICIDTAGIRGAECGFRFDLVFNGRQIERAEIEVDQGTIRFCVKSELLREKSAQELLILTECVKCPEGNSTERRRLGMPIRSVSCQSLSNMIPLGSPTVEVFHENSRKGLQRVG